ncbi:MAG: ArsR family transcriptional regulator [Bacteroidales bacterium]|nr:ArsR family transcriptional regulator [Bacteroidales bacterium]
MKNDLRLMMVSDLEADLIEAARNYVKSYPDGYPELLWYVQELFDEVIEIF